MRASVSAAAPALRGLVSTASFALLLAVSTPEVAFAQAPTSPAAAGAADTPAVEEARKHFKAGVALLQDPDGERVDEAYAEFKTAHELSQSPKILGNIGLCAMKLERDGEAITAYESYLQLVEDIPADEKKQILQDVQLLRSTAVRVSVTATLPPADQGATLVIEDTRQRRGVPVVNTYPLVNGRADVVLRAGHHLVKLRVQAKESGAWEFDGKGGTQESHVFDVQKDSAKPVTGPAAESTTKKQRSLVLPVTLVSIGGAALIAGTVTGIVTLGKVSSLKDECPNNQCRPGFESDKSTAKTLAPLTDVLLFGGAAVAAAGIGIWVFGGKTSSEPKTALTGGGACTTTGCAGTVRFSF